MASVSYSEHLTCSICLHIFTDPVTLPCGHSFCRGCITNVSKTQHKCPECRTLLPVEGKDLPTSHILKSLAEKAKEKEREATEQREEQDEEPDLCPEHEEKLRLFCVTDQQLACIVCRDGKTHQGHEFKPISEAAATMRKELEKVLKNITGDLRSVEGVVNRQNAEITKTKEKAEQLRNQIDRQFEKMHEFLRRREDEIKDKLQLEEDEAVDKMSLKSNMMEAALCDSRVQEVRIVSILEVTDSVKFLKCCTENKNIKSYKRIFRARGDEFQVVNGAISLGPYESHMQFFVWKEMLQVVGPRAEFLSLKRNCTNITVSDDGRSLSSTPQSRPPPQDPFLIFNTELGPTKNLFLPRPRFGQPKPNPSPGSNVRVIQPKINPSPGSSAGPFQTKTNPSPSFNFGLIQPKINLSPGSSAGLIQPKTSPSPGSSAGPFQTKTNPSPGAYAGLIQPKINLSPSSSAGPIQPLHLSKSQVFSVNEFSAGQHYWEIDVGHRDYWELGIKDNFLRYEGQKYSICSSNTVTELSFGKRPRKIGIYLNCSLEKLSLYDADSMTHIHSVKYRHVSPPLSAYFNIRSRTPDPNPMTVCWY